MKLHIKALLDYEENNNRFELLCNFIDLRRSDLLNSYCEGKLILPSFVLLKKLKAEYANLVCEDNELNSLFENAINSSKIFYSRTLKIIGTEGSRFDSLFSQRSQPVGQQLINLLANIKLRIWLIKRKRTSPKQSGILHILKKTIIFITPLRTIFNNSLYKLGLLLTNSKYNPFIYFIRLLFVLSIFLVASHYFINDLPVIQITEFGITLCTLTALIATLFYPIRHFGKIDINGKDVLAYKYRFFFNNTSNKKMYQVFALQHSNISRQKISPSIDSL